MKEQQQERVEERWSQGFKAGGETDYIESG
jgi:hypothetical protein